MGWSTIEWTKPVCQERYYYVKVFYRYASSTASMKPCGECIRNHVIVYSAKTGLSAATTE